jgi:hypothetical protein
MRKALLGLALVLALSTRAGAGNSNQTINIQGVLRDATGSLQSMAVGLVVNLYSAPSGGKPFFTQNFTTVSVDNGYFSVELSDPALTFKGLTDAWVGVQVSGDPTELPRQHLGAAPFAFSAASLDGSACSGCVADGMIAAVSATKVSGILPVANGGTGSMTQNFVDLSSNQMAIGGNKTFTGLVAAARDVGGAPVRVCSGSTPVGNTAWAVYGTGGNAITLNVDTSGCGFTTSARYIANLACNNVCWMTTGGNNPYNPSPTGFQIYVNYMAGGMSPTMANGFGFHIEWVGVGN